MKKLGLLLFLASCTLYPKYARPPIDYPDTWRIASDIELKAANLSWWKQLKDPTLDALIEEALACNQDLKAAIERVNAFVARLGIASSRLYPQINANGGAGRQRISQTAGSIPPGTSAVTNAFSLVFNATYLLDIWGKIRSESDSAYHSVLSSIEARKAVVLGLVSSVATTYIQLRQFDKQLFIAKETWQTRKESYELALIRYDLGLTSELEVDQAFSEIEAAEVEVERLQISIAEAENLLSLLLGRPSMAIKRGLTLDQMEMPPQIPTYLPSEVVNQRPDVRQAEERLIALNALIGVARARFFPEINLVGGIGSQSNHLNNFLNHSSSVWNYGTTILQEIYTGGRLTSGVALAEADMREALHQYQSSILTAFREVNDALIAHKINLELVDTQRDRVETLKRYLYISNLRYNEGQVDYLNFLDAERQLFRAMLDYAGAQGDSFISMINLYKALGGGWVGEADDFANTHQEDCDLKKEETAN